jgi:hypothetical protein
MKNGIEWIEDNQGKIIYSKVWTIIKILRTCGIWWWKYWNRLIDRNSRKISEAFKGNKFNKKKQIILLIIN